MDEGCDSADDYGSGEAGRTEGDAATDDGGDWSGSGYSGDSGDYGDGDSDDSDGSERSEDSADCDDSGADSWSAERSSSSSDDDDDASADCADDTDARAQDGADDCADDGADSGADGADCEWGDSLSAVPDCDEAPSARDGSGDRTESVTASDARAATAADDCTAGSEGVDQALQPVAGTDASGAPATSPSAAESPQPIVSVPTAPQVGALNTHPALAAIDADGIQSTINRLAAERDALAALQATSSAGTPGIGTGITGRASMDSFLSGLNSQMQRAFTVNRAALEDLSIVTPAENTPTGRTTDPFGVFSGIHDPDPDPFTGPGDDENNRDGDTFTGPGDELNRGGPRFGI